MSGIAATLTQTERGRREPVTHVGQPSSIRQESGRPHTVTYTVPQFLPPVLSSTLDPSNCAFTWDNVVSTKESTLKLSTHTHYIRLTLVSLWEHFHLLGINFAETLRTASKTWDQSAYLQNQYQQLGEVLRDMHIKKPVIQVTLHSFHCQMLISI